MHAFERGAGHQRVLAVDIEKECALDHQEWPESLAGPEARIAHGGNEPPRTGQFLPGRRLSQKPVEQRLGVLRDLVEAILKLRCRVHSSPNGMPVLAQALLPACKCPMGLPSTQGAFYTHPASGLRRQYAIVTALRNHPKNPPQGGIPG